MPAIPNNPIIIVTPLSLIHQWAAEAVRFLAPARVEVFIYNPTKNEIENYFADNGPWGASKLRIEQRVIIASASVSIAIIYTPMLFLTMFRAVQAVSRTAREVFKNQSTVVKDMPAPPPFKHTFDPNGGKKLCLFSFEYNLGVLDESHSWRTISPQLLALSWLFMRCHAVTLLTGTPIFTSTVVSLVVHMQFPFSSDRRAPRRTWSIR